MIYNLSQHFEPKPEDEEAKLLAQRQEEEYRKAIEASYEAAEYDAMIEQLDDLRAKLHAAHEGNARLQDQLGKEQARRRTAYDEAVRLQGENNQLRNALEEITVIGDDCGGACWAGDAAKAIARRALDHPPQPPLLDGDPDSDDDGELAPFGQWPQWAGAHDGEGA